MNVQDGRAKMDEDVPLPGFRFYPTDEELLRFYLRRKIDKKPIKIELIKQIDIYKYDPWDLPSMIYLVSSLVSLIIIYLSEVTVFSLRIKPLKPIIKPLLKNEIDSLIIPYFHKFCTLCCVVLHMKSYNCFGQFVLNCVFHLASVQNFV